MGTRSSWSWLGGLSPYCRHQTPKSTCRARNPCRKAESNYVPSRLIHARLFFRTHDVALSAAGWNRRRTKSSRASIRFFNFLQRSRFFAAKFATMNCPCRGRLIHVVVLSRPLVCVEYKVTPVRSSLLVFELVMSHIADVTAAQLTLEVKVMTLLILFYSQSTLQPV